MQFNELIRKKRDGGELTPSEIQEMISRILSGDIPDYQISAWLMAVFFRGLTEPEMVTLTEAMWKSGETIQRDSEREKKQYWVDKHSTGGVGDKTSLILVPLVTEVGRRLFGRDRLRIPMISGRGLGFSGGTLDKMEAVPGFQFGLSIPEARKLLSENGFFMLGQTATLAPADRILYALRDATATVESIPLIVASILSKKLSENLNGLVLDIKVGRGAFMPDLTSARKLARAMCGVAKSQNVAASALITRMDEPLGWSVGHLIEVKECLEFLRGKREKGLEEVVLGLASEMLSLACSREVSPTECQGACLQVLGEGAAVPLFKTMFQAQGGDWEKFEGDCRQMETRMRIVEWAAPSGGYLQAWDARRTSDLVNRLGGGRAHKEDRIDLGVGLELLRKVGESVTAGETLARVYFRRPEDEPMIRHEVAALGVIGTDPISPSPWILETHR